jgi:hypothetical protein
MGTRHAGEASDNAAIGGKFVASPRAKAALVLRLAHAQSRRETGGIRELGGRSVGLCCYASKTERKIIPDR